MVKKYPWIEDDRIPSQAEIDFYGSFDDEGNPTENTVVTQGHLDEIQGGQGIIEEDQNYVTLSDFGDRGSDDDDDYDETLLTGGSKRSREKGGVGQIGGRQAQFGRKQMVTGSKKASILAP